MAVWWRSYSVLPAFWGHGFGTEVAALLVEFAFATLSAPEVRATTLTDNRASGRILEKPGTNIDEAFMRIGTILRVARPTDHLDAIVRFYTDGVGLVRLGGFEDHDGFDGVMLGTPDAPYHLEFTGKRGHVAGRAPTEDNLLVFYLPDRHEWEEAINRMVTAGYEPVRSFNPYWDRAGRTFEDPDGYRVVFQNARWSG